MVEKYIFNYLATALVDVPAVSMPIARSPKTSDIYGIMLLSHHDLFHLSLCLSPPPPGVTHLPHYPQCIYTCVLCCLLPVCLILPTCFPLPAFSSSVS
jgi:hypothetical protein